MKSIRVFAVLCMAMLLCVPAFAQNQLTGAITGHAHDSSGAIIPGVEVTISSPAMIGGSRTAVTDEQGVYRFPLLTPGLYKVSFALPGFKTINETDVNVTNGVTRTIDGPMEVATTAEEVTVTSQAPTIDLETATVNVNWSQKMMDELPWSRSLTGISMMIPSAFSTSLDIGNSNFGTSSTIAARSDGRSGGNVVLIDGLQWCQTYSDYGTFEEMNISSNSKGADQMNSGITISMVTKAGSNVFHGNATTAYQNGSFSSNNISQALYDQGFPQVGGNHYTHFTDYYGDVGGPILKDKLWFYIAPRWAYQGTYLPGFVTAVNGPAAQFYTVLQSGTGKFTYQLTPKQKIEAYMGIPDKHQPYRGASSLVPQDDTQNQDSWSGQGPVFTYTNILDSKTSLTAKISRGGYWWPAYTYGIPSGLGPTINVLGPSGTLVPTIIPQVNYLGVSNVGVHISDTTSGASDGAFDSNYTRPIRWQENIDFSRFVQIGGKNNELKVGFMNWWDSSYSIDFRYPYHQTYVYKSTNADPTCPGNNICSNYFLHPYQVTLDDTPNNNQQGGLYKALYVNDKITLSRKLTLNVGLRWDWAGSFLSAQGNDGNGPWASKFLIPHETSITNPDGSVVPFPTYKLWSPRFSFAYDLFGNGKVALKASYGRYIGITSSPNSQPGPGANSSGVDPIATTSCTYNNWDGSIPFNPKADFGPDGVMGSPDDVNLSKACAKTGRNAQGQTIAIGTYNFDPALSPNYLDEYTAAVEYSPNRNYSFRAGVSRKFDIGGSVTNTPLLPFSKYTQVACGADPGGAGLTGVNGGTTGLPGDQVCAYSVPKTDPNFLIVNNLYKNYAPGEGTAQYTGYDFTFNKNYANKWSFLAGYGLSFARSATTNPINPNQMLYNHNSDLGVWRQALKFNANYGLPAIPFLPGHKLDGIQWTTTYTAQTGEWYDRTADITDSNGTKQTFTVDPHIGRYPWTKDWDQRITKRFKITDKQNVEFRWDLYNTMNSNTIQSFNSFDSSSKGYYQTNAAGVVQTTPLQPKTILAPRIYEWGVSYRF